jgi:hypothetical protein
VNADSACTLIEDHFKRTADIKALLGVENTTPLV